VPLPSVTKSAVNSERGKERERRRKDAGIKSRLKCRVAHSAQQIEKQQFSSSTKHQISKGVEDLQKASKIGENGEMKRYRDR